jgi:hypothetical protein
MEKARQGGDQGEILLCKEDSMELQRQSVYGNPALRQEELEPHVVFIFFNTRKLPVPKETAAVCSRHL